MKKVRLVNPFKEMLISKGKKFAICTWIMMVIELTVAILCFHPEWWPVAIFWGVVFGIDVKKFIIDFSWYPEFIDDMEY